MTELICRFDSTARAVSARIVETLVLNGRPGVVPDRTVLYPAGGGQPSDHGRVNGFPVVDLVHRKDGAVVHVLDCDAAEAARVGQEVVIELDWDRRFDHMQQHTAQHIVTALAGSRFGWKTIAFHMNPDCSDIEFEIEEVPPMKLAELEDAVNRVVVDNIPVTVTHVTREEMALLNVRSRLLPEGLEGPIRLVDIAGIDTNTCGGTHVTSTGQVQAVKFLGIERLTRGWRVFYVAGSRLRRAMERMIERESAIGAALTTGPADFVGSIESLKRNVRDLGVETRTLRQKLAVVSVERMIEAASSGSVAVHHEDEPDPDFLRAVAERFRSLAPDGVALLTGGVSEGTFILAGPESVVAVAGPAVAGILQARGGGRGGIFQGRAKSLSLWTDAVAKVQEVLNQTPDSLRSPEAVRNS